MHGLLALPDPVRHSGGRERARWLRRLGLGLAAALLLSAAAVLAILLLMFQHQPLVAEPADVAMEDLDRTLALARSHDPRRALPGIQRVALLSEGELDLLLNHAARRWLGARVQVSLEAGRADILVSAEWPGKPLGTWLNVRAQWAQTPTGLPRLEALRLGRLPVPVPLVQVLAPRLLRHLGLPLDPALLGELVLRTRLAPDHLRLVYAWQADSTERMLHQLLHPAEHERLRVYQAALAQAVAAQGAGWTVSLPRLMPPLFALAQQRSAGGDAERAAAENRAALLVLTFYANHRKLDKLVPDMTQVPRPPPRHVLLARRVDLPRHYLVSAVLVTESTRPLARAIGLHKELSDARGGSGFSFNDMAANLAGQRLGEMAQREPRRLQALLAAGVGEAHIMPAVHDLPEHLSEADFQRRFGGVGGAGYRHTMAQIESRIAALPLFR
jgi:hypothetical protein